MKKEGVMLISLVERRGGQHKLTGTSEALACCALKHTSVFTGCQVWLIRLAKDERWQIRVC